tara:strand:- start:590 stop:796 length:207 start_codon:yes stop_codon:yes gene_type:complete
MPLINAKTGKPKSPDEDRIGFTIKDTEFLLRHLMISSVDGKDIEIANSVLTKLKKIHEQLMQKVVEVN